MYEVTKDLYEISIWEDVLVDAEEQQYEIATETTSEKETFYKKEGEEYIKLDKINDYNGEKYIRVPRKLSFFKEEKIAVIGANDHNAPELAYNPKFIDDVKGEHTLTFTMNGKYYDKELETFVDNPYIKYLVNERKIKLFFRDEWYDLIIKKVEENKKNYSYTYTATDLFINELGKNGFKVELDTELENNQGTAEELAAQVLEGTDWRVSSYNDKDSEGNPLEYKSDLLVETNLDTLYKAYLCKDILVKVSADGWLPIREEDVEPAFLPGVDDKTTQVIKKGEQIYLFYSDLIAKNPEPMILYRAYIEEAPVYQMNDNEDIIINSYNFRVTRENKVTYNDNDVPMPDFIIYDEYMPENLSISNSTQTYFYEIDKNDGTINFVTEKPENYRGLNYKKQEEGKFGITLEDKCRAYETVRRAETGYDPVTDEFVTYFLQRLYTLSYVKTGDSIPYSNKAYFTKVGDKYVRFYGYTFGAGDYYELQYNEFLRDGEALDSNTQYYVKSQVPEYVPTTDSDVNYYLATYYKNGVQYFYFNEVVRQYLEVHFNNAEEFNSFGKEIYYRENKIYYLYDNDSNEYKKYGNFDVYTPTKQVFNLGSSVTDMIQTQDTEKKKGKVYYTKTEDNIYEVYYEEYFEEGKVYYEEIALEQTWLRLPPNLAYYIKDENGNFIKIEDSSLVEEEEVYNEQKYYLHSLSTCLPVYNKRFVYEQSGKMIEGYIKYEESVWSRIKGYTDTEYLSPTLVQNYLSNSMEISSLNSGWIFDGAPSSDDRAGELTNRLDDPTLPDPDEDPTSSLLILHLTDSPVYYASQTGEYLYTNYNFVVSNPMISNEEFWGDIKPFFEKEEIVFEKDEDKYTQRDYKKITAEEVKKFYLNRIVFQAREKSNYWIIDRKPGAEYLKESDVDGNPQWIEPESEVVGSRLLYYVIDGDAYDLYCIKVGNGLYRSVDKIYFKPFDSDKYQQILHYIDPEKYGGSFYIYDNGEFKELGFQEANRYIKGNYYYTDKSTSSELIGFDNKWDFFKYDKQLYFYKYTTEEQFYAIVGYTADTPIYGFKLTQDESIVQNKAYYKIRTDLSKINSTADMFFESTNNFKFEGGVNQYFTYNVEKDIYEKVNYGAEVEEGRVYYEFKPTGKMQYLPYDYYKDAWENAAIRDYLDSVFPSPGYEAYVPFKAVPTSAAIAGKVYWAKRTDGTYQELDDYALRNYLGDYVYEKWEDEAIAELQAIFNFEYTEDELTEYAKDLLDMVSDLLDWADYEQESRIEILNAIDLFGIKRAILLQKLRRLQKNYPDVEGYQREELLKYLGLLNKELNQDLRIEMSVISDPQVVNYVPTKDPSRKAGKKYYYFEQPDHSNGEVSLSFMAKEYTGDNFYQTFIDGVEYRIMVEGSGSNATSLASLIIYEFNGELPDMLELIGDGIDAVEDSNKVTVLEEISAGLEEIRFESSWSYLNPIKMFKAYQALLKIKEWLKDDQLIPDTEDKTKVYNTILDFYQIFLNGNNSVDSTIWRGLGFISNDIIPFYVQSLFSRAKVQYSVQETIEIIERWLADYRQGKEITYLIYDAYSGKDIKALIVGNTSKVTIGIPKIEYTYNTQESIYTSKDKFDEVEITSSNINLLIDTEIYYVKRTQEDSETQKYENLLYGLQKYANGNVTYVKVDTSNEPPNPNEKYYIKDLVLEGANGQSINSLKRYFKKVTGTNYYNEITTTINSEFPGGIINSSEVLVFKEYRYIEVTEQIEKWETYTIATGKESNEYYRKQPGFIDYSKSVTYNTNLAKALKNLEEVIALRFDDVNELKTGNKVFDEVTEAITGFTIIWHLEKDERQQVVEGTKLLINLSKQLTALQISDDFIDFCLDRRYEGHKRRALNTGFAANRNVIKKLNKGEEYVLAFSLGRYFEGDEPPTYTKRGSFSYGDIENKYYYFDNIPTGVGDFTVGNDEYKEIFYGEPNYDTPYGWMEAEGRFELATNDDTINPLFVCIAQETVKDKFATRFVKPTSSEIGKIFFHEEEKGDYICVRRPQGLFKTVKVFEKANDYKWFNGSLDQVLMNDGKWRVLFNSRKSEAKRFRRSPTYVCMKAEATISTNNVQTLRCVPCDQLVGSYVALTEEEIKIGPVSSETYYVYNKEAKGYDIVVLDDSFEEDIIYYRLIRPNPVQGKSADIQYFKRTADSLSEGNYKLDVVTQLGDVSSDGDFYKILTVSEIARGPERGVTYYTYDAQEKMFKDVGGISTFDEDTDYYYATYDRDHFSFYTSDDLLPDLYCFVPDNNGDYVHIIRKEQVEEVNVKWYQFWLREENMNKIYREFKDTDSLATDAPHYFKRYNSAMDYDFHTTSWKDGHLGPWKEKYQRYSKFRVHLYDNTELDENYTYWISKPFSDGSECYTLFTQEQPKRFTLHKRYLGYENGTHQYLTLDQAIEEADDKGTTGTNHVNVNDIKFNAPANYKNYMVTYEDGEEGEINYSSGGFIADLGVKMVPVKIDTRMFRPFENETDSQRVPYVMIKSNDNLAPSAGIDWIYCQSQNASDAGYYRPATVDDTNAYTNWQISEGVDELLGLYKFLKVKDPLNWNSDEPPFTFATPVEVSMLSHEYAMRVIKSLNTPYWWGRTRYHTFAEYTKPQDAFDNFINFVKDFWEWGDRVFISAIWRWITGANTSDEFVRPIEKFQDWNDKNQEWFAGLIRKIAKFFDFSEDNHNATKILNWIDGKGIDINSDDPDYLLVNYSTPLDGVNYYTKQEIDGKWTYVIWDGAGAEGERKFVDGVNYFILEAEQEAPQEWLFKDLNNNVIGLIKYAWGSNTITYHYFPNQLSSYFEPISHETAQMEMDENKDNHTVCFVNAKNGGTGHKIDLVAIDENYTLGGFIKASSLNEGTQYYHCVSYESDDDWKEENKNLTYDARLFFWDAMYGLYGSQWENIIERENFGLGGTAFLNTEDEFTDEVLKEIYAFTELWVREVHNGVEKIIPFDPILHSAKPKYYRHTYSGELKDAMDGITEIYYNDGGTYKYYATKSHYDTIIPINYDGLKVSFCEYDYEASNFRISPTQTDDTFEANLDYSNHHKVYLDFDCSNPIEGYFDLTISPEISGLDGEEPLSRAIKERYIWWKAPVQHNYNLTEDLYSRVGTLFYTDSKSLKSYPITSAQLFKYKVYKSNNIEVLTDFKKQFYEYETLHPDTYEPTFEEYKALKEAFQGYFGIDEWNKVENLMDIRYDGVQRDFTIYESYLEMLSTYLTENGDRTTFLKDRIIYNTATGQYSFRFKNRKPIEPNRKVSTDMIKLKFNYYEDNWIGEDKDGKPIWGNSKPVKTVIGNGTKENYINYYEWQEAAKDLQVPIANFDNVDLNRFNTLIKNLMYKYSMYEVGTEERADVSDVYYTVSEQWVYSIVHDKIEGKTYYTYDDKTKSYLVFKGETFEEGKTYYERSAAPYYELKSHDGFSTLPSGSVYRARALRQMEIQKPDYEYKKFKYEANKGNPDNNTLNKDELEEALLSGSDLYYFGYNKINNHDTMFKFVGVQTEKDYNTSTAYYKKVNGLWTRAWELTKIPGYEISTEEKPVFGQLYYEYIEDQDKYELIENEVYVKDKYYVRFGPLGNISYYTWDNNGLIYYRENCQYINALGTEYDYNKAYYMHEDMPETDASDFHDKAQVYGKLYPYDSTYEVLTDINEEIFNNWQNLHKDVLLYKQVVTPKEESYMVTALAYNQNPNSLYIKYWYPLADIKSQKQFEKYYKDGELTGEAPYGVFKYHYDENKMYLRGGSDFYIKNDAVDGGFEKVSSNNEYVLYNPKQTYYITNQHVKLTHKQMLDNYLIIEPYIEVTKFDAKDTYWTYTLLRPEMGEGYRNNTRYYLDTIEYEKIDFTKNPTYESDIIYCRNIADNKDFNNFYTREITVETKVNGSGSEGIVANLRVTFQLIDGLNGIWPFEPEVYENVMLWPNANEGYLARRIEELAYLHRKDYSGWNRIWDPNPFKYFVCDGVYSELIGVDTITAGKTYEVTVTLDTRLLAGHHDISENYNPDDLNCLSSLNNVAATWWDQQMARQEVHYKKASQSVNDFWSSLFSWVKGERPIEETPDVAGSTNNGKNSTSSENQTENTSNLPDDTQDNVVIMNGEVRKPNLITLILPNRLEQELKFDDVLEQWDANIEDWFEGVVEDAEETFEKIEQGIKNIDKVITENTKKFVEEVKETRQEIKTVIEEGQEKTKQVVTKIVDYIEDTNDSLAAKAKAAVKNTTNTTSKVVTGLVEQTKTVAKAIGNWFKPPKWFAEGYDDEIATTLMNIVNADQAVNNSLSEKLTAELRRSLILSNMDASGADSAGVAMYMTQLSDYLYEVAQLVTYIQQLGYYDFLRDYNYLSNIEDFYSTFEEKYSNPEFINRILAGIYREAITNKMIMALPGEVPDNNDLILTNYFLYNPELPGQDDEDTLVYDYVGNDALNYYIYDYDDLCQKVRGIETKEKNYLSALSQINEKFECWIKYELEHYTEEENAILPVMKYDEAHTPGEVKMVEREVWIAEDDETDIVFEPINIPNSHISNLQDEAISALTQFNPRTYWYDEVKNEFEEVEIHKFEEGIDYYIVTPTGSFKKVDRKEVKTPVSEETYYTKKENANADLLEQYEKVEDKTYYKEIMMVPLKTIYLKQFTGDLNYAGFRYGINLKSIKRTLDSKEFVSRLIVKENTNEHAMDGFCTIQRAPENPIKESFILNFDYYVQHGMLNREELWQDLYGLENGYYSRLAAINKDLENLVDQIAEVNECLDRINANYETYALARDAAQQEIEEMAITLAESMPNGIPSPWKYNMAKETEVLRTSWSDTKTKQFTTKDKDGNVIEMTEHVVQGQTRAIEIPKYSDDTQKKIKQMDIFQKNYEKYRGWAEKARLQKKTYEDKLKELYAKSDSMSRMKNNLNAMFFKKYYRFIQEGSWKDDKYMDDTLYYLDALATSRTSAFPKATYDIQTIDLETLSDYKGYAFRIGDKSYIEDTEFFGYTQSGKPYQEEIIVTKLEHHLDDASKNKITVSNYKTQFEDMFKRIAATVAKVEMGIGSYNRANAVINETAIGAPAGATTTVNGLLETVNGSVSIGAEGLVTTEIGVSSNKIKIVNGAIYRSTDGGTTYQKVMTADGGIDPSAIGYGNLDLSSVTIGTKEHPELSFTANGMTAFMKRDKTVDYSTFVRFDSYGMYGIKNYKRNSSTDDSSQATLNDVFIPTNIDSIYENASYGLTWDGFFLNTGDGTGRVTIGTNQDLRMSTKNGSDAWQDRLVIGKLQNGEEEYYGFRIIDDNNNIVLNTDDRGQLYLRHKLHISHFNDEYGTISNEMGTTVDKKLEQTNITLGIVKAYKRLEDGGYAKGEDLHDNYSSLDYLTKILSVKSAVDGYNLKTDLRTKKNLFKQFTSQQLETLIDPNENLAIFDNGNLYAKNAWVEGNIRAMSGNIIGELWVGEKDNQETENTEVAIIINKDKKGSIQTSNYVENGNLGWCIEPTGTAYFNDVFISGIIKAATFEYDKIQTLGGAMIMRPSFLIKKWAREQETKHIYYITFKRIVEENQGENTIEVEKEFTYLITKENYDILEIGENIEGYGTVINKEYYLYNYQLELDTMVDGYQASLSPNDFGRNCWCKIGNNFLSNSSPLYQIAKLKPNIDIQHYETELIDNEKNEDATILYIFADEQIEALEEEKETLENGEKVSVKLMLMSVQSANSSVDNPTTLLAINSATERESILPPEAFSVFGMNRQIINGKPYLNVIPRVLLGKLNGAGIPEFLENTYGLYADNAYLKGSLILEDENGILRAGVSTAGIYKIIDHNKIEHNCIFWSESKEEGKAFFYVDDSGYMHAENGYFSGTLESSILKTAKIIGTANDEDDERENPYGLTIVGNNGLIFSSNENQINTSYFSLGEKGAACHNLTLYCESADGTTTMEVDQNGVSLYGSEERKILHTTKSSSAIDLFTSGAVDKYLLRLISQGSEVQFQTLNDVDEYNTVFGFSNDRINLYKKLFLGSDAYVMPVNGGFDVYID